MKKLLILILESVFCFRNIPKFLIKSKITYEEAKQKVVEQLKDDSFNSGYDLAIIEKEITLNISDFARRIKLPIKDAQLILHLRGALNNKKVNQTEFEKLINN